MGIWSTQVREKAAENIVVLKGPAHKLFHSQALPLGSGVGQRHQTGYLSQGLQTQMPTGSRPETLPGEAGKLGEDNRDWWGLRQTGGLTVLSQSGVAASGSSHCSLRGNASPRSPYSLIV